MRVEGAWKHINLGSISTPIFGLIFSKKDIGT